ncbi:unnamed protein product [Nesidiocoris tenuis]|uniref:Ig-like domain-containing protein n=1 Tax=Nesidiocoris tenuis TaxID=355587 RepID=A0A6H5H6F2_9HEMI|nr:unnamed protein product [Nesidiocoris tenuis]
MVKPVNVSGLKDTRVELGKKVRLVCRCRGHPQPALAWYKDGHPVRASNASRIEFRKKRTSLVIPKAKLEDAGRYECRATSVTGQVASAWANVTVTIAPALTTRAPSLSPYVPKKCPIEKYCLNGGTCALYDTVQELVCTSRQNRDFEILFSPPEVGVNTRYIAAVLEYSTQEWTTFVELARLATTVIRMTNYQVCRGLHSLPKSTTGIIRADLPKTAMRRDFGLKSGKPSSPWPIASWSLGSQLSLWSSSTTAFQT